MKRAAILLLTLGLHGCAAVAYYWQGISGQAELLARARPIAELISDETTPRELRQKLELAQAIRAFAARELALPDNASYARFSELGRAYLLWNVFATPRLSLQPELSCYPVAGCVAYRGYFEEAQARREAAALRARGLDVHLGGVPAYSTLGWFADPLPSTVIHYGELELARLMFHELAHQVVYVKDDTTFNESFAVAVEEEGLARWVAQEDKAHLRERLGRSQGHRQGFRELIRRTRDQLADLYASPLPEAEKLAEKARAFAAMQAQYRELRQQWGGYAGYDAWFARELNNASLVSVGLYADKVPQFKALLVRCGGDLPRFYAAVRTHDHLERTARGIRLADAKSGCAG